jgi:hypothetical protein
MQTIEITFGRAVKVWWSYAWRSCVLFIPVAIVVWPLMFFVIPRPHPGEHLDPGQLHTTMHKFFFVWLFTMAITLLVQVQAMRWMLKTRWRDFRLMATDE